MGLERVLELLKEQGKVTQPPVLDAYVIVQQRSAYPLVMACVQKLRATGLNILMHAGASSDQDSMKSQFKRADSSGAQYALIFGIEELYQGLVTVKSLRDGVGAQSAKSIADIVSLASTLQSRT
jgi:histidyl-tRNA synthetase